MVSFTGVIYFRGRISLSCDAPRSFYYVQTTIGIMKMEPSRLLHYDSHKLVFTGYRSLSPTIERFICGRNYVLSAITAIGFIPYLWWLLGAVVNLIEQFVK